MRPDSAGANSPPTRREILLAAFITTCGFLLRVLWIGRAGLSQFDEGVYAFSALGLSSAPEPHTFLPGQERIAPPLFALLASLVARLAPGNVDTTTIVLNVVLGTLTVTAVWWIGRQWFGAPGAVAAATIVALNEALILVSRTALSDTAFTLFLLIALHLLARAVESGDASRSIVAGLVVAATLNTKYHGWFALVIVSGAVVWRSRGRLAAVRGQIRAWSIATAVTVVGFLPWALYIWTRPSSVEGFARHYGGFLRLNWIRDAIRYIRLELFLDGPLSRLSLALALAALFAVIGPRRVRARWWVIAATLALASATVGSFAVLLLAAIVSLRWLFAPRVPFVWTVAAGWCLLWLVAAPLYQPYFRLLGPLLVAAALVTGRLLADLVSEVEVPPRPLALPATLGLAALVLVVAVRSPRSANPWSDSRSLARAADSIATFIPAGTRVRVVGEPPLAFYLHRRGRPSFEDPTYESLQALTSPTVLVTGIYTQRSPVLRDFFAARGAQLQLLGTAPFEPSDLRVLDDFGPLGAAAWRAHPDSTYLLHVWNYTPANGANR